jgi:hypothetical protein
LRYAFSTAIEAIWVCGIMIVAVIGRFPRGYQKKQFPCIARVVSARAGGAISI